MYCLVNFANLVLVWCVPTPKVLQLYKFYSILCSLINFYVNSECAEVWLFFVWVWRAQDWAVALLSWGIALIFDDAMLVIKFPLIAKLIFHSPLLENQMFHSPTQKPIFDRCPGF